MPRLTMSKESLKGLPTMEPGIYDFRLDGFNPAKPKAEPKPGRQPSINLNPDLKIINNEQYNDRKLYFSGNTAFGSGLQDFVHSLGLQLVEEGEEVSIPGPPGNEMEPFAGGDDPKTWSYQGPLVGRTGKVEVVIGTDDKGKPRNEIKRFICAVPGCEVKHMESMNR